MYFVGYIQLMFHFFPGMKKNAGNRLTGRSLEAARRVAFTGPLSTRDPSILESEVGTRGKE